MAHEWTKVELFGANNDGGVTRYTIADGASVSKGAVLQVLDGRVASSGHLVQAPIAGIASEEHIAGQGVTSISVWTNGIFNVTASGVIAAGISCAPADASNVNKVCSSATTAEWTGIRAIDSAAAGETFSVRLNL